MTQLVFLLEEPSARVMLEGLLPKLLCGSQVPVRYIVFEGKGDMDRHLVRRLRGYVTPDVRFVLLRDKHASDCHQLKADLLGKCRESGRGDALVRIVCHELESWYLADLAAVEKGLGIRGLAAKQDRAKFRTPDSLANAAQELRRMTSNRYQKIGGSRAIAPHMDVDNRRSTSFDVFVRGLRRVLADHPPRPG